MATESRPGPRLRHAADCAPTAAVKVPQVTALFWVTKALTTAFGESASDWSVRTLTPVPAVLLGFALFCVALTIQFRSPRYSARRYWFAVAMVGVFGTMAADVLHVGFGVPYAVSTALFVVGLVVVFVTWRRVEGTLSVHSIDSPRRELFYWAAVVATFALGTAAGDLVATVIGLGYFPSAVFFAALIAATLLALRFRLVGATAGFWTAYVLTRPVGATVADWLGKSRSEGGVGVGSGVVTAVLAITILAVVTFLVRTRRDAPA